MFTNLILVRHGQSTWNAEKRWQGQADPPLTELGRQQAVEAAHALHRVSGGKIDSAVSSPQLRAAETADILVGETPAAAGISSIERIPDLRERSAGPWSGLTKPEIEERYPGFLDDDIRPPGYELDDPLFERIERALLGLHSRYAGHTVLAVCHGGVINTVADRLDGQHGRTPNLSGFLAHTDGEAITLGARFDLLGEHARTGGDARRV